MTDYADPDCCSWCGAGVRWCARQDETCCDYCDCRNRPAYSGPVPRMPRPASDAPESEWKRYARKWQDIARRRWTCDCPCYCQDVPAARAGERKDSRDG